MPVDVEIVEEAPAKQSYAGDMKSFLRHTRIKIGFSLDQSVPLGVTICKSGLLRGIVFEPEFLWRMPKSCGFALDTAG